MPPRRLNSRAWTVGVIGFARRNLMSPKEERRVATEKLEETDNIILQNQQAIALLKEDIPK